MTPARSKALFPLLMPQAAPVESIDTYAVVSGACTNTQKDSFALGDEVCARVSNSPLRAAAPLRRVSIGDTDGTVAGTADITSDPQTFIVTLPSGTTSVVNGQVVDNRGAWSATINSTDDNGVRAVAYFSVSDPTQAAADLAIYAASTDAEVLSPGQSTGFSVYVNNVGPDAAADVHVTQTVPPFMTFDSATAGSGAAFTCSESSGVVDCAPAGSLAKGAVSNFTLNYTVSSGAPSTLITTDINVDSDTDDPRPASNSSTVKVEIRADNAPPATCSVACPGDITVNADATDGNGDPGAVVNFAGNIETSGDCGAIQSSPASGSFFPVGPTTVTVTSATGGGSCSFVVTVTNVPPPTISCPANIGVQAADNECNATVDLVTPETTGDGVTVAGSRNDGQQLSAPYPAGTTTITWTATDSLDRKVSCQQTVTVTLNDTTSPTITAPPDVTVSTPGDTTGNCGVVVGETELGSPATDDNCPSSLTVSRAGVPAGNFFPVGTTTITYTVKDSANNTATATQHVTVVENTPPHIAAPPDASYTCPSEVPAADPSQATNGGGLDENGDPLPPGPPSDNCGVPTVTVTETRSGAGSAGDPLVIKRTFTATDAAGNTASSTQTITVKDPTPPALTLNGPSSMTVECHTGFTDPGATATDNCGAATVTTAGSVDANTPGTYTLSYTATDAAGNTTGPITRTVTVVDTTPPVIALDGANPLTWECHTAFTDPGATATDSCDTSVPVTVSGTVNANAVGTYTLTYNASDDSGNAAATVTRTVNVVDTTPPVITTNGSTPSLWPANHKYASFTVTNFVTGATDSCDTPLGLSGVTVEKVTSDETENGNGDGNTTNDIVIGADCKSFQVRAERNGGGNGRVYTVTFRVKDASGNVGRATAKIVVPQNPGQTPVDSGANYTVNGSCPP